MPPPAASHVSHDYNVNELPEPPVVKAVKGVAKVALLAVINPATGLPSFDYNNQYGVVPTIELKPGETFVIDVKDELRAVGSGSQGGKASAYVNLHFHGLTVSPRGDSDDVLHRLAMPGESLHYVVHVPKNQMPGLYWYHSHVHGQTSFQVGEGGMSGMIVIDGLEQHIPALAKMRHRLIIVRSTGVGKNAPINDDMSDMSDMGGMSAMPGMPDSSDAINVDTGVTPQGSNQTPCSAKSKDHLTTTLNGAYRPQITISPGEKQFWRVVNASGHKTLALNVEGEDVSVVAIDGFAYDANPGNPISKKDRKIIIPPAARAEFVVTGPAQREKLRTLCYNTGPNGDPDREIWLGTLVQPKHKEPGYYGTAPLAVGAPLPQNAYTSALPKPVAKRLLIFSETQKPHFFINGKSFKMSDPPMYVVHTGTTEEWTIHNVTNEIHDFHIHQIHFLVEEVNGVKLQHPYWADSVVIPHRKTIGKKAIPGSLVLLMDFRDPIIRGEFLFHCHILDHEDLGMMAKIEAL